MKIYSGGWGINQEERLGVYDRRRGLVDGWGLAWVRGSGGGQVTGQVKGHRVGDQA